MDIRGSGVAAGLVVMMLRMAPILDIPTGADVARSEAGRVMVDCSYSCDEARLFDPYQVAIIYNRDVISLAPKPLRSLQALALDGLPDDFEIVAWPYDEIAFLHDFELHSNVDRECKPCGHMSFFER